MSKKTIIRNGSPAPVEGYYQSKVYPEVYVSKSGNIIRRDDHAELPISVTDGRYYVFTYDADYKKKRMCSVGKIVASTLLPQAPHEGSMVTYINGDTSDYGLANLRWGANNKYVNKQNVSLVRRDVGYDVNRHRILTSPSPEGYEGYQCAQNPSFLAVSRDGSKIVNLKTGKLLTPVKNGQRLRVTYYDPELKQGRAIDVLRLVAEAYVFNDAPETHVYVHPIDGNPLNVVPENLYWSKSPRASEADRLMQFQRMVTAVGDGENEGMATPREISLHQYKEPVESKEYPGHYVSDLYPWVVVSSDGKSVIDINTGKVKAQSDINGYKTVHTFNPSVGAKGTVGVHRIVASAFKRPDHEGQTHVNHINLIRDDNRYINLEWVTPSENTEHAHFYSLNNGNLRPVKALDIRNGSVSVYESALECSRQLGIDKSTLWGMLERRELYPWQKTHIFIYLDEPWPRMDLIVNPKELAKNRSHRVEAWDVVEDKVISAEGHTEIAKVLGMSRASIQSYLRRKNTHVMNGYVFRYADSGVEWPSREEALAYMRESDTRAVLVHVETGEVTIYPTKKAAGEVVGMNKTEASKWFRRGDCVAGYKPYPYTEYMEKQNNATL